MSIDQPKPEPCVKPTDLLWPAALAHPHAALADASPERFQAMNARLEDEEPMLLVRAIPSIGGASRT